MTNQDCIEFLQWALPRLHMRWPGFRKVRRQVCKRVTRRMGELGLTDIAGYRAYLSDTPAEWQRLDAFCRITISRFYRDRGVFEHLRDDMLPDLARRARDRGDPAVRCWSAGCGSGEEPYSIAMAWAFGPAAEVELPLQIVATDADPRMIERARLGRYSAGSFKDLPPEWIGMAFRQEGAAFHILPEIASDITFVLQDIRAEMPDGHFHLVLCRNLAFTYFDKDLQRAVLARLIDRLTPAGVLVIGKHEKLPEMPPDLRPYGSADLGIFRKPATVGAVPA